MLIFLAHPVAAPDREGVLTNARRAKRWLRYVFLTYPRIHPIAPWIPVVETLDDSNSTHRKLGRAANFAAIERADGVWLVGGRISPGMLEEARFARDRGLAVFDFTPLGEEPPLDGERPAGYRPWDPAAHPHA